MASVYPELDVDFSPIPRSREENQERAFVAASRRKDRSLDARLESANRASMLHKKRTGKALHITKDIVEKEAMYEEVDERYQEKRLRMLHAQNMQIEEQFQRQLLAAFAAGANSTRPRHSISTPRVSTEGVKKMRPELPTIRASFTEGSRAGSIVSPIVTSEGYVGTPGTVYPQTPGTPYVHTPGSYVQTPGGYSSGFPSPQIPQYLTQQTPTWEPQAVNMRALRPQQNYQTAPQTDIQSVDSWRRRVLQQSLHPETAPIQTFRARQASAPEPQLLSQCSVTLPSETLSGNRAQSEPSAPVPQEKDGRSTELLPSLPDQHTVFTEVWDTPELCPSPSSSNSASNMSGDDNIAPETKPHDRSPLMVSTEELDPDFESFTRFALGLGNSSQFQDTLDSSAFDDWVTFDLDFAAAA